MDFGINEMLQMQQSLQKQYQHKWEPISPETGKNKLLWMIGEVGEVIDIVKKNGGQRACTEPALRADLVEELADVLMYYNDILLCYFQLDVRLSYMTLLGSGKLQHIRCQCPHKDRHSGTHKVFALLARLCVTLNTQTMPLAVIGYGNHLPSASFVTLPPSG